MDAEKRIGRVEVFGTPRLVHLGLLDDTAPGDWVLVQTGFAVEKSQCLRVMKRRTRHDSVARFLAELFDMGFESRRAVLIE